MSCFSDPERIMENLSRRQYQMAFLDLLRQVGDGWKNCTFADFPDCSRQSPRHRLRRRQHVFICSKIRGRSALGRPDMETRFQFLHCRSILPHFVEVASV